MNKLALGTAQFGLDYGIKNKDGKVSVDETRQIISLAKQNKIDTLDTAISYGTSEEVLGKVGIGEFRVITKLPSLPIYQSNVGLWVQDHVQNSLDRLGQEKLYGLLLHHSWDLLGPKGGELLKALIDLKDKGVFQKIGISIYDLTELDEIFKKVSVDLVQAPLNVIDRRMETSGWLDRLKDNGVEIHTRSAFLQGLLLMERNKIPEKFSRWSNIWDEWHKTLQASESFPLEACLAYPLSFQQVDKVVLGVDTAAQLLEILTLAQNINEVSDIPSLCSTDLDLINPSNWRHL